MRPKYRFLRLCVLITCVSLAAMVLPVPPILRALFALPLVLVLPGAALLRALNLRFAPGAHAPIVVGLSMAITVVSGLALNGLGWLNPFGWAVWLGGFSILLAEKAGPEAETGFRPLIPNVRFRHAAMLCATTAVLVLTVQSASRATAQYHPFPHTSFWMLPLAPTGDVYLIGIKNDEGQPETYAVQLMVGQRVTGQWEDLRLIPGQSLTYPVVVRKGAPAQAWLFRAAQPESIYRWVTVAGDGGSDNALAHRGSSTQ